MRSWIVLATPTGRAWWGRPYNEYGKYLMTGPDADLCAFRCNQTAAELGWRYTYRAVNLLRWWS